MTVRPQPVTAVVPEAPRVLPEAAPEPASELAEAPADPVVPHWDELSVASIPGRPTRLSLEDVRSLLAYEHAHAGRLPVLRMLENRIRKTEGESGDEDRAATAE